MEKRGASWSGKVSTNSTKLRPERRAPSYATLFPGKRIGEQDEQIRGGLKYRWAVGASQTKPGFKPLPPSTS